MFFKTNEMITMNKIHARLYELASLRDGWHDGQGKEITRLALNTALAIGSNEPHPYIYPMPDGGISLEWDDDDGTLLTVEVRPDGAVNDLALLFTNNLGTSEVVPVSDIESVLELLQSVYQ